MKTFIIFISAYFTIAACVHRLAAPSAPSRRIVAWVGLTIGLIFSCGILFALPAMAVVTILPVALCALAGLSAAKLEKVPLKVAVIVLGVGLAVAFHLAFGRNAPKQYYLGSRLKGCSDNLKMLHTRVEEYAKQHEGKGPETLSELTPEPLETLPLCPVARSVTYQLGADNTIFCQGDAHRSGGLPADHPRWEKGEIVTGKPDSIDWYEFE